MSFFIQVSEMSRNMQSDLVGYLFSFSNPKGTVGVVSTQIDSRALIALLYLHSWYYHELWVSKHQRVSKCDFLRDRISKLADLCLDI